MVLLRVRLSLTVIALGLVIATCWSRVRADTYSTEASFGRAQFGTPTVSTTRGLIRTLSDGTMLCVGSANAALVAGYTYWGGVTDGVLYAKASGGEWQAVYQDGTPEEDNFRSVAVDSSDNIFISGWTIDGVLATNTGGAGTGTQIVIMKLDKSYNRQWIYEAGIAGVEKVDDIVVGPVSGDSYTAGGTTTTEPGGSMAGGGVDLFILRNGASDGTIVFEVQIGLGVETSGGIVLDSTETYGYLAIRQDSAAFSGTTTYYGQVDALLVRFNCADGSVDWAVEYGSAQNDYLYDLVLDPTDSAYGYAVGSTRDVWVGVSGMTHSGSGTLDMVVVKFATADGSMAAIKTLGGALDSSFFRVAAWDSSIYIVGSSQNSMYGPNAGSSSYDGVLVKMDSSLNVEWGYQFGTSGIDYFYGISLTQYQPASGSVAFPRVVISGETTGAITGENAAGNTDVFFIDMIPKVTAVTPGTVGWEGGDTITIEGYSFGGSAPSGRVDIDGVGECTEAVFVSDTMVTCQVPAGTGSSLTVAVTLSKFDGWAGHMADAISYESDLVHGIMYTSLAVVGTVAVAGGGAGSGAGAGSVVSGGSSGGAGLSHLYPLVFAIQDCSIASRLSSSDESGESTLSSLSTLSEALGVFSLSRLPLSEEFDDDDSAGRRRMENRSSKLASSGQLYAALLWVALGHVVILAIQASVHGLLMLAVLYTQFVSPTHKCHHVLLSILDTTHSLIRFPRLQLDWVLITFNGVVLNVALNLAGGTSAAFAVSMVVLFLYIIPVLSGVLAFAAFMVLPIGLFGRKPLLVFHNRWFGSTWRDLRGVTIHRKPGILGFLGMIPRMYTAIGIAGVWQDRTRSRWLSKILGPLFLTMRGKVASLWFMTQLLPATFVILTLSFTSSNIVRVTLKLILVMYNLIFILVAFPYVDRMINIVEAGMRTLSTLWIFLLLLLVCGLDTDGWVGTLTTVVLSLEMGVRMILALVLAVGRIFAILAIKIPRRVVTALMSKYKSDPDAEPIGEAGTDGAIDDDMQQMMSDPNFLLRYLDASSGLSHQVAPPVVSMLRAKRDSIARKQSSLVIASLEGSVSVPVVQGTIKFAAIDATRIPEDEALGAQLATLWNKEDELLEPSVHVGKGQWVNVAQQLIARMHADMSDSYVVLDYDIRMGLDSVLIDPKARTVTVKVSISNKLTNNLRELTHFVWMLETLASIESSSQGATKPRRVAKEQVSDPVGAPSKRSGDTPKTSASSSKSSKTSKKSDSAGMASGHQSRKNNGPSTAADILRRCARTDCEERADSSMRLLDPATGMRVSDFTTTSFFTEDKDIRTDINTTGVRNISHFLPYKRYMSTAIVYVMLPNLKSNQVDCRTMLRSVQAKADDGTMSNRIRSLIGAGGEEEGLVKFGKVTPVAEGRRRGDGKLQLQWNRRGLHAYGVWNVIGVAGTLRRMIAHNMAADGHGLWSESADGVIAMSIAVSLPTVLYWRLELLAQDGLASVPPLVIPLRDDKPPVRSARCQSDEQTSEAPLVDLVDDVSMALLLLRSHEIPSLQRESRRWMRDEAAAKAAAMAEEAIRDEPSLEKHPFK